MKRPKNDFRPYRILLIPDSGEDAKELTEAWADPDHALGFGIASAGDFFSGPVEVVVIDSRNREAVRNILT